MKSFIINLEFRKDRLEKINYNLIKNHTVFNAIHFPSLSEEEKNTYKSKLLSKDNKIKSDDVLACFVSHYLVLSKIANQNEHEYVYVFEDDVEIIEKDIFLKVEEYLPKDFDILMLGGVFANSKPLTKGFYIPKFGESAHCTESYIVSKKGAKKIVDFINNKAYTTYAIDWYFHFLGKNGAINYYAHEPLLTTQNHSDSNIKINI